MKTFAYAAFGIDFGRRRRFPWPKGGLAGWWVNTISDASYCPVEELVYGTRQKPKFFLAARKCKVATTERPVDINFLTILETDRVDFVRFCLTHHIPTPNIGWKLLVSHQ